MTQEQKIELYKRHQIIVTIGKFSDKDVCKTKGCKKQVKFLLFEGATRLSGLLTGSCDKHLGAHVVKHAKLIKAETEKIISEYEANELQKAKNLIVATK